MTALLILATHMVGDYVTQNDWMAANKFKSWKVRTVHVAVYTVGFVPVAMLCHLGIVAAAGFLGLVFGTHWITDCRRWASGEKWCPKPIMVDQTIHITTLAILAYAFGLR